MMPAVLNLSRPGQLSWALAPELLLMGGAMLLMLWAAWRPDSVEHQRRIGVASLALTVLTMAAVVAFALRGYTATVGVVAVDNFRWAADVIFLVATLCAIALSMDYNAREGIHGGEAHVLLLLATSGMMLLAAARDLIIVFLGVELMSIAVYALSGMNRRSERSAEGALKYFLLGAFSTAFLLYGIALVYGATGSTNLITIGERVGQYTLAGSPLLTTGIALMLVGFGFKVAAAPFHMWAPDVYEGAPTPVTAYMAAAVKAAAFAAFLRVWIEAFPALAGYSGSGGVKQHGWHFAVWWLAVVTMVAGNAIALAQRNIKRLLAYSSIAHAGYVLVAVVVAWRDPFSGNTGSALGGSAFLFYLLAYTLATMGAFGVVIALGNAGERNLRVEDYSGLWTARPWLAVAMSVFMLALLGFPIFGGMGFFAKWYMLQAALGAPTRQTWLAVWLVVTSVVSAGYYLYVVMVMFMRPRAADAPAAARVGGLTGLVIGATAVLILVFGIYPSPLIALAQRSAPALQTSPRAPAAAPTAALAPAR